MAGYDRQKTIEDIRSLYEPSHTPCPLCGSSAAVTISETSYAEIWSHLQAEWGALISDVVKTAHTLEPVVRLQACAKCHLQYFSPAISGSSQFYSEVTSSCSYYYTDHKWEFDYVKKFLKRDHKVLDVACGKGAFLRSIIDSVGVAIGIDTNPDAVSGGNESRLRIYNQSVEDFSVEHGEEFDLVSAFQVIEHLGSVMPFVGAAYRCVKPGGTLVLSVPNRARRKDLSFGSLDYPPHHISRWAEDQLSMIALALNAELVSIAKQPLDKSQTVVALRLKEIPELLPLAFIGRDFIIKVTSRLALTFPLSLVWRNLNMAERLNMYGMSLVAIIRKPMAERPNLTKSSCPIASVRNGYKDKKP
jgi:2-polyprenyl-3-methyl-5-hydroxy-6-metoxy-1,4-benzoquinol methylase